MSHRGSPRNCRDVPTYEAQTCADDLAWMLDRLRAVGIEEVVAVDLTRPELGMPVARVVIPGLEGPDDHERYVPGPRVLEARGKPR
jgi:ribosomal protein S12 methylthiotransferase accessory factor YcaO